jgi:hypothetical protein
MHQTNATTFAKAVDQENNFILSLGTDHVPLLKG